MKGLPTGFGTGFKALFRFFSLNFASHADTGINEPFRNLAVGLGSGLDPSSTRRGEDAADKTGEGCSGLSGFKAASCVGDAWGSGPGVSTMGCKGPVGRLASTGFEASGCDCDAGGLGVCVAAAGGACAGGGSGGPMDADDNDGGCDNESSGLSDDVGNGDSRFHRDKPEAEPGVGPRPPL